MPNAILIVEDEALLAKNMQRFLARSGNDVRTAASKRAAIDAMSTFQPDIVIIDHNLPDGSGLDLLNELQQAGDAPHTIFMTGHGSIQLAVDAMKAGASEFVSKPLVLEELSLTINKLIGSARKDNALSYYNSKLAAKGSLDAMIGESTAIKDLKSKIMALINAESALDVDVPLPVLVTGETGTGKQLVARALHFGGSRSKGPFVELNCAALPEQLVESELFGHERGAFTDAKERKIGLFEAADGGTLFLDEVGELPLTTQAKLLKVIESQTIRKLGSIRDQSVTTRIIAATNRNLRDMIKAGTFRSDLYFRLQMLELQVPPLREREGDILLLADYFLTSKSTKYRRSGMRMSENLMEALKNHRWPGNVRELRNTIERAILLTPGNSIGTSILSFPEPEEQLRAITESPANRGLFDIEREALIKALNQSDWNVSEAARLLGISRDTLRYRMAKFNLRQAMPN
jgi:two-component system, NtrC family, response regulator AtoC